MPEKCVTCDGSGTAGSDEKGRAARCPDCKGAGERLTALDRRISVVVLAAIVVLSGLFIWVMRQLG